MNKQEAFKELRKTRLMRDIEEVKKFEQALQAIMREEDIGTIKELCKCFDDKTEQEEVMFGIVHAVEYLGKGEKVIELAKSIPLMLPHAKEWAKTILYGILNEEKARKEYTKALFQLDEVTIREVVQLLQEIKEEDPKIFGEKVDKILKCLDIA